MLRLDQRTPSLAVLCVCLLAAYAPSLSGEFILDDRPLIQENGFIRDLGSIAPYFLQEDGVGEEQLGKVHSGYYRPLTQISYALDYQLWGLDARGFRATNLLLHVLTCLLLYLLLERSVGSRAGAFIPVLLFGLHPANTESVAWVASRNNILATLFSMACLYFYLLRREGSGWWTGLLSFLCFALALLSKEFALVLPLILFLWDRFLAGGKSAFRERLPGYLAFAAIGLGYLVLRFTAIHTLVPLQRVNGSFWSSIYYAPYLILENLKIIFLPFGLHNFMVRYPEEPFGAGPVLGFLVLACSALLLWRGRRRRVALFSCCSFLIALLPVLNIFPTSAYSLISMRWLYFPMCFLAFGAAWACGRVGASGNRFLPLSIVAVAAVYLGTYTFVLNENLWKTEERFFRSEVSIHQNLFYAGDLARIHHDRGEYGEAERLYTLAERHQSPDRIKLLIRHAALLIDLGQIEPALRRLEEAERMNPAPTDRAALWNNRGAAFFRTGDYETAVRSFGMAAAFAPDHALFKANLSRAQAMAMRHTGHGVILTP